MSEILSTVRVSALLSPRTAKYVEALIREGNNFDYDRWLKRVRAEEAQAKQVPTAITCRDVVAARVNNPINTLASRVATASQGPALLSQPVLIRRTLRIFKRVVLATPCTDTWRPCSQSLRITEYDGEPIDCCGARSSLRIVRSARTRTLLGRYSVHVSRRRGQQGDQQVVTRVALCESAQGA
jgi:hypothetical protein